ncbi:MAG: extracellular solute-binding protein [Candidatus Thorarchaeota archaeon]
MGNKKSMDALIIVAIIVCSTIITIPLWIPRPPPEVTLRILTFLDIDSQILFEEPFLSSAFADDHNIVDIEWIGFNSDIGQFMIGSGNLDLVMVPSEVIENYAELGYLKHIDRNVTIGLNETIAGVPLKGYDGLHAIWCTYGFYIAIYELLVNTTMLQEYGLSVPTTIEDLASPQYAPNGPNSSLIGYGFVDRLSEEHEFQHLLTKQMGWEEGIKMLTTIYANSRVYEDMSEAELALEGGEIAITMSTFTGNPHEPLPFGIVRTHLEDQVAIIRDAVGIDNATQHPEESEGFVKYLLSPECQSNILHYAGSQMPIRREAFEINPTISDYSIYSEFNWTARSEGMGIESLLDIEDLALWYYLNSTAFASRRNLTICWENLYESFNNGSITQTQFENFRDGMGELLNITDPLTNDSETFTEEYAVRIALDLYIVDYEQELSRRWRLAANLRYDQILFELSALL